MYWNNYSIFPFTEKCKWKITIKVIFKKNFYYFDKTELYLSLFSYSCKEVGFLSLIKFY